MPSDKITTNGQLRQLLADTCQKVVDKKIDPAEASVLGKLAAQISENMYAEIKARELLNIDFGQAFGSLPINGAGTS